MTHEDIEFTPVIETEEAKPKRKRRASRGFGEVEEPQMEVAEESQLPEEEHAVSSFDSAPEPEPEPQPEPVIEPVKQALIPKFQLPVRPVVSNQGGGPKRGTKRAVNTKR